jgi:hypothetical protein
MPATTFTGYTQVRESIGVADVWNALAIPVGARNALIMLEDATAIMRVSSVNTVLAASQGSVVAAGGSYQFEGTLATALTIYVAADKATVAILQYTTSGA